MIACDRCHRKFTSQAALLQHFRAKHPNVSNVRDLEEKVAAEKEYERLFKGTVDTHGPTRLKIIALVLVVVIAISVTGYVAFSPKEAAAQKLSVGAIAPDFTLTDVNGATFRLSDYRGKQNILLFFNEGLGCQPCLSQMRDLDDLNGQFGSMNILLVTITPDPMDLLSYWVRTAGPHYGKILSDQNLVVSKMYNMLGADISMMPGTKPGHTFLLVNESGVIIWRADYGPMNMYVPNSDIIAAVRKAMET